MKDYIYHLVIDKLVTVAKHHSWTFGVLGRFIKQFDSSDSEKKITKKSKLMKTFWR